VRQKPPGGKGLGRRTLLHVYRRLVKRFGPGGWWPGESAFEVCLGAILTQNTSWANADKALAALRADGRLTYNRLRALSEARLARLIRSSGTFSVKARRIGAFLSFLGSEFGGDVEAMRRAETVELRSKLLDVHGIGPETADAIVLYAVGRPLFVVDAYTRRVFTRLGMLSGHESYDQIQRTFMEELPRRAALFNDYHAQIVRLAKRICRPRPLCRDCPLNDLCPRRGVPA
jgi:endonuclease-3 related protein